MLNILIFNWELWRPHAAIHRWGMGCSGLGFSWTTSNLVLWDTMYCLVLALFVYCYIMKDKLFVLTFFFSLSNTHGHKNYACTIPAITMHILILHILGVWKILPFISKIKTIFRTPNVRVNNMKKDHSGVTVYAIKCTLVQFLLST